MKEKGTVTKPVLIKKGEPVPENATPMNNDEVMSIQMRRIEKFKPQSEMAPVKYGNYALCAAGCMAGVILNFKVRQAFRLGGLRRLATYGPSAILPGMFCFIVHEFGVKRRILVGKEACMSCISIRSGVFQVALGVLYPYAMCFITCTPIARDYYTLPMPAKKDGMGYARLFRQVTPKANLILTLVVLNMLMGMQVGRKEMNIWMNHLSKPPSMDTVEQPVLDSESLPE